MPEQAIIHQLVFSGRAASVASASWPPSTSASSPSDFRAVKAAERASGAWRSVSVRCIKLNCRSMMPVMPLSFPRISPSSVGQSILEIRSMLVRSPLIFSRRAFMPMPASATSTASRDGREWVTVSLRCTRLKSRPLTPVILPSLPRISPSSVGQSIFSM